MNKGAWTAVIVALVIIVAFVIYLDISKNSSSSSLSSPNSNAGVNTNSTSNDSFQTPINSSNGQITQYNGLDLNPTNPVTDNTPSSSGSDIPSP